MWQSISIYSVGHEKLGLKQFAQQIDCDNIRELALCMEHEGLTKGMRAIRLHMW